ncbi:M23 family metallopeptidase [Xanthobacter sediminis]
MTLRTVLAALLLLAAGPLHAEPTEAVRTDSTALFVSPLHEASWVPGDDGKLHVEYDLLVVNTFPVPVTVSAVEVLDPAGRVLSRFTQPGLAASTQTVLDQAKLSAIPANGAAAIEVDLVLDGGPVPERLTHRIFSEVPQGPAPVLALITKGPIIGPEVAVRTAPPIAIRPPLKGKGWAAFNGCCTPNLHRSARNSAGTRLATSETYAIDYLQFVDDLPFTGDGSRNEQYPTYDQPVLAVAGGEVVAILDGMADVAPNSQTRGVEGPLDFGGNYVLQRIAPGVYAFYAHFRTGTVAVKVGDRLKAGDELGKVGSSGNSTAPHLHFGLLDRPDIITGNAVPFVFTAYTLTGRITKVRDDGLDIEKLSKDVKSAYPLVGGIATYE